MLFYVYPLLAGLRVICQKYLWNVEWWGGKFYIGSAVCGITIYPQSTIQLSSPTQSPRVIIIIYIRRCFAKRVFGNTPYICLCYIYILYVGTGLTFYFTSCFSVLFWHLFILMFACVLLLAVYLSEMTIFMFNQSVLHPQVSAPAVDICTRCADMDTQGRLFSGNEMIHSCANLINGMSTDL